MRLIFSLAHFALCVSSCALAHGEEVVNHAEVLAECLGDGPAAWVSFEGLARDKSIRLDDLRLAIRGSTDWRMKLVVDALEAARTEEIGPSTIMAELLTIERSWREKEMPTTKVPDELPECFVVIPIPGFDPRNSLRHVLARSDRLKVVEDAGVRAMHVYLCMTIPKELPASKEAVKQLEIERPHELLCARMMAFMRLMRSPCGDELKQLAIMEIEKGFSYGPLRDYVKDHCDDDVLGALKVITPCRLWGQTLAAIPGDGARQILMQWSETEDTFERVEAYVSLLDRQKMFHEDVVAERIRELEQKHYNAEVRDERMRKIMEKIEQYNAEQERKKKAVVPAPAGSEVRQDKLVHPR